MPSARVIVLPTCSICQDDEGGMDVVATNCGHVFHRGCIRTWDEGQLSRRHSTKCPSCNVSLRRSGSSLTVEAKLITLHSLNEREIDDQGSSQLITDPASDPRLARSREEIASLKRTLQEREATIQQLTREPAALRAERDTLNSTLQASNETRQALEDRLLKCSRDLRIERKERNDERLARCQDEKRVKSELDKVNEKYRILKSEGEQLQEQYLKKVSETEELQSFVSEFAQEKARFQATEAALKAQLQDSHEKFKSLKAANSVYKGKLEEVKKKRNMIEDRAGQSMASSVRRCGKFYPDVSKSTIQLPAGLSPSRPGNTATTHQSGKRAARESAHGQPAESSKRICWTNKTAKDPLPIDLRSSLEPEDSCHPPSSSHRQSSPAADHLAADHDLVLPSLFGNDLSSTAARLPPRNKLPLPFNPLHLNQSSASSPFRFNKTPSKDALLALGPKVRHR
ncbi:hypothetical protein PtA15_5A239 [Puccinia triticina]|uniref:RING-type domain-containing protein n=1 Tax=Puccinia triticina TaxID=208348 RepID=A0ABY7CHF4_9BASI|nr:uncharacterized protein PtA15_5A239 [Puccinia triticina]WAQ84666.1 hypothetical protein PtA15_5A239 [Puccinia triticina]WAR58012.1 hypothetical protein PtB15_5B242 [Puccinia triticina]